MTRALFSIMLAGACCILPDRAPAQLRVISSGGFRAAYTEVLPVFEQTTGITVTTGAGPSQGDAPTAIGAQLRRGVPADVVIMSREGLDDLIKEGRIAAGSDVDLAQSPLAVAVRAGAPHPDISTVESLRETLLRASSVTHQGSTTGQYMMQTLFPRLGVLDAVTAKLSSIGAPAVASGEVEIALQPLSELIHAPGVEVVGNVPAAVQFMSVFSAAVVKGVEHADAAHQLIAFLASAAVDKAVTGNGMERVTKH